MSSREGLRQGYAIDISREDDRLVNSDITLIWVVQRLLLRLKFGEIHHYAKAVSFEYFLTNQDQGNY